jgi:hypothetical protein
MHSSLNFGLDPNSTILDTMNLKQKNAPSSLLSPSLLSNNNELYNGNFSNIISSNSYNLKKTQVDEGHKNNQSREEEIKKNQELIQQQQQQQQQQLQQQKQQEQMMMMMFQQFQNVLKEDDNKGKKSKSKKRKGGNDESDDSDDNIKKKHKKKGGGGDVSKDIDMDNMDQFLDEEKEQEAHVAAQRKEEIEMKLRKLKNIVGKGFYIRFISGMIILLLCAGVFYAVSIYVLQSLPDDTNVLAVRYVFVYLFIYLFVYLFVCLFICLFIYLFVCLFVYLFVYLCC